ncbi:hypothetical protein IJ843_03315 [bacterium]|nr:hypothetical protein [bacterium]
MNYGLFIKISLILAIIATICICVMKPQMHTNVMIYDSSYKIVEQNVDTQTEKEVPTVTQVTKPETIQSKIENIIETKPVTQKIETTKQSDTKVSEPIKTVQKTAVQKTTNTKVLTEQQEEIEWNKWRSNLQNQIMRDVKLPIIPQGTIFKFEFDVDKYGKVSNVQTWSMTSSYTPYAIQYIAPVIRSYQGKTILNFPSGSNRTETHVTGGWKIAAISRYSTPKDYNDTETVKK